MKVLLLMLAHLLTTLAKLLGPVGARAIVADSLLMKQQLLIINRSRRRAPNLTPLDRMLPGFWSLFLNPHHIQRAAVIIRPSTLLKFHDMLKKRKYRLLYTARRKGKPGPKGPSQELIEAIVELKQRNPRFVCPCIAQEINKAFGVDIDKEVVRRVLGKYYRPGPDSGHGPSWLTFIGHLKDSLWSTDLFRCESITIRYSSITNGKRIFESWIDELKSIPYTPCSHPFIERLIGTIRREFLDHILFWNAGDLVRKLADFQTYYNHYRPHSSLGGDTPTEFAGEPTKLQTTLNNFRWQTHCRGLYQLPAAA